MRYALVLKYPTSQKGFATILNVRELVQKKIATRHGKGSGRKCWGHECGGPTADVEPQGKAATPKEKAAKPKEKATKPKEKAAKPKETEKDTKPTKAAPAKETTAAGKSSPAKALLKATTPEEVKAILETIAPSPPQDDTWTMEAYRAQVDKIQNAEGGVRKEIQKGLQERDHGTVKVDDRSKGAKEKALVKEGHAAAELLIHPDIAAKLKKKQVKTYVGNESSAAGVYSRGDNLLEMNRQEAGSDGVSIYVHEMGHFLEEQMPGLHEAGQAFKKGLESHEFVSDYASSDTVSGGSEIISTGLEHYHRSPLKFAQRAPKHFLFIQRLIQEGKF